MSMEHMRKTHGLGGLEGILHEAAQAAPTIMPAMPPPDGMKSNFDNPPEAADGLRARVNTVGYVMTAIAFLVVCLRVWTRAFIVKKGLGADDYCIMLCMCCSITFLAITIKDNTYGTGLHLWNVPFETFSPHFLKYEIAASAIYTPSVTLSKLSILLFYLRLSPERPFRIAVYILMFIVVGYSITSIMTLILGCLPVQASWDLTITDASCINRNVVITVLSIMNILTDIAIVSLPIKLVLGLQMSVRQKASLICVFLTGFFVCACALVRTVLLKGLFENPDYTWEVVDQYVWSFLEMDVGIICASFPAMKPFFTKYLPFILNGSSMGESHPSYGRSGRRNKGSYQLSSMENNKVGSNRGDVEHSAGLDSYGGYKSSHNTIVAGRRVSDDNSSTEAIRSKGENMGIVEYPGSNRIMRKTEVSVFETDHASR